MNGLRNILLCTDSYKLSHMRMYHPGVTQVYSYLEARKEKDSIVFFGLQYFIMEYLLQPITPANVVEYFQIYEHMFGSVPADVEAKMVGLQKLGYWPLEICAIPEGTVIQTQNVIMTMRNTNPDFPWTVGFLESLLLKIWNTCSVATCSLEYKKLVEFYARLTCDSFDHIPYSVHDFGYRGVSSEETAALSGAAHLLSFLGSDTIPAIDMLWKYYPRRSLDTVIASSVPASEHSVMCSYSKEHEYDAIDNIIFNVCPTGIVSVVSDTFNLWTILTDYIRSRRERILARDGCVVFRPDSGDPVHIVCGTSAFLDDPEIAGTPEGKGALQLLWDTFGGTTNSLGFKVLNKKVGLIYGDGMHKDRFNQMLATMANQGWASSNLVIGVGGLLLQQHNRDDYKFAMKAVNVIRDGEEVEIYKDPITDKAKKSKKGFLNLHFDGKIFTTTDQAKNHACELLKPVFRDGAILKKFSLEEVRETLEESRKYGVEVAREC